MLKHSNLRITRQRMVILEELRRVDTHPSADEVYALVRRRLPRISLGTVYRNLEILSAAGEIQRLEPLGCLKRFDGNPRPHYHLRCVHCGRLVDFPAVVDLKIQDKSDAGSGFQVSGYRLEFVGCCPDCAENSTPRVASQK